MRKFLLIPFLVFGFALAIAQESETYKIACSKLNEGGDKREGTIYQIDNDSLGAVAAGEMSSENFQMLPPECLLFLHPQEIKNLKVSKTPGGTDAILTWDPEANSESYNVYRDFISELRLGNSPLYLACHLPLTTHTDIDVPSPGTGFYYLVTGKNKYGESTLGWQSNGKGRINANPCP